MADGTTEAAWGFKPIAAGEWAGWSTYGDEPFEDHAGPFYARLDDGGQVVCAFRADKHHMNGGGFMHGGCLMTFADYSIFVIARQVLEGHGSVTASMNCEFVDAGREGDLIECRGEVVRGGASLVFVRGQIAAGGRVLLNFSSIIKKLRRRSA
ncbi:MAG TPA: PaaI family thioesterase [Caulobacteraceae bacterium]|nr:PaaI family thioesterase [Caulobacteraceae bacterium]